MSNQYQAPPRKKTIVDYAGLRLTAPATNGAEKRPSLAIMVNKNLVRFDVYTNVPNDKKNGNIRAELDPNAFQIFLKGFEEVLNAPAQDRFVIDCKDYVWNAGQRSEKMVVQSKLMAAKDKNGRVYLSLLSYDGDRPKIQFFFESPWKNDILKNGQPMGEAELSVLCGEAFLRNMKALVPAVLVAAFEEPVKKDKGGNGGGGGNNYNRNQNQQRPQQSRSNDDFGGSDSSSSSDGDFGWDDDMPM